MSYAKWLPFCPGGEELRLCTRIVLCFVLLCFVECFYTLHMLQNFFGVGRICSPYNGSGHGGAHDDVIKWKHFPCHWSFVWGIHRSSVNSPHKGQWRGTLMFSLICAWINGWVNHHEAGDLRRYRAHYDVIVMDCLVSWFGYQSITKPGNKTIASSCPDLYHIFQTNECFQKEQITSKTKWKSISITGSMCADNVLRGNSVQYISMKDAQCYFAFCCVNIIILVDSS